jgi:excisionase family DNA binding protein
VRAMKYYSPREAAEILSLSTRTIFRRIADGSLDARKLSPRCIRISENAIRKFVEATTVNATESQAQ